MEYDEALAKLKEIAQERDSEIDKIRVSACNKSAKVINDWAREHARFKIGDIIQSFDNVIQVTNILGHCSNYVIKKLYVEYRGNLLTKKLQPRKDGAKVTIYDDGREIKKLK